MSGRDWFKHDAWFLADDKIRSLGHDFGAAGPLVAEAFLELAKRQRTGGYVRVKWAYLAEHAFVNRRGVVQKIVSEAARLGFIEIVTSMNSEVEVLLPKWQQIQGSGLSGAERTAAWRDRQAASGDVTVTSGDDDVTSPRAGAHAGLEERRTVIAKAITSSENQISDEKTTEEDHRLCRLLAELAKANNPKFKVGAKSRWLTDMRLLRERDHNSPEEIERVVRWTFTDTGRDARFWARTIRSPGGLREHFSQLWAQMTSAAATKNGEAVEDSAGYLARKGLA